MAYQLTMPQRTIMGENALNESGSALQRLGNKAFIVSGKNVTKNGIVDKLTDRLGAWGMGYAVFNDITGEPTTQMIDAGVAAYQQAGCDFLIGIGGGSPLDSAKAIAAMTVLSGKVSDYMGKEIEGDFPPVVLIPTTAGTGSEATKFTVITDTEKSVKMLLKGDALLPRLAIVDPELTRTAPQSITAATGMDALTHAVEAYVSIKGSALTDMYAIDAIKRIFGHLPKAYSDGGDKEAREQMAVAAYQAGVCINNASVTLVHGMSRPIGALFHVPHGISNAMLISKCLAFVMDGCVGRFAAMARAIGAAGESEDDQEAAMAFIKALDALCEKLKIPSLAQYGIDQQAFEAHIGKMAQDAMASTSPSNSIKPVSKQDLESIYHSLWA